MLGMEPQDPFDRSAVRYEAPLGTVAPAMFLRTSRFRVGVQITRPILALGFATDVSQCDRFGPPRRPERQS